MFHVSPPGAPQRCGGANSYSWELDKSCPNCRRNEPSQQLRNPQINHHVGKKNEKKSFVHGYHDKILQQQQKQNRIPELVGYSAKTTVYACARITVSKSKVVTVWGRELSCSWLSLLSGRCMWGCAGKRVWECLPVM